MRPSPSWLSGLDCTDKMMNNICLFQRDRDRTHIFTTFFYNRLTTRPKTQRNRVHAVEDNPNLTPAQKRYDRVKRWTKSVNIFEKDFVIVPINEQ